MRIRLEFNLCDLWLGAYIRTAEQHRIVAAQKTRWRRQVDVWLCVLPCMPLHVTWWGKWHPGHGPRITKLCCGK